jgi:hypothetical protein
MHLVCGAGALARVLEEVTTFGRNNQYSRIATQYIPVGYAALRA